MPLPFLKSKNDYFQQDKRTLTKKWTKVYNYLTIKGYSFDEIKPYRRAYFYFVFFPHQFDGATMTEDLRDFMNLELDAMLHDFHYIAFNVSSSYKLTQQADKLMCDQMLRKGKSSWNTGARRVLLKLKSLVGFHLYSKHVLKREVTQDNIENFNRDLKLLA